MNVNLTDMKVFLDAVRIPIRIACKTKTGWPMVISMWYIHQDGLLYCATQKSAKVVNYLKNDSRCAFEIAEDRPPYCGIRGQARATIDNGIGKEILEKLLIRYLDGTNSNLSQNLLAKSDSEVAIVLKPVRVFTWDFSERMIGITPFSEKICP